MGYQLKGIIDFKSVPRWHRKERWGEQNKPLSYLHIITIKEFFEGFWQDSMKSREEDSFQNKNVLIFYLMQIVLLFCHLEMVYWKDSRTQKGGKKLFSNGYYYNCKTKDPETAANVRWAC